MSEKEQCGRDRDEARTVHASILMSSVEQTDDEPRPGTAKSSVVDESDAGRIDKENAIAVWQASAQNGGADEDNGTIARILWACIESLMYLAKLPDSLLNIWRDRKLLRRCAKMLKLWATGHGAWEGRLDSLLGRSKNLQHATMSILSPLCKVLSNGLRTHTIDMNDAVAVRLRIETARIHSQTKWQIRGSKESIIDSSDSDSDTSAPDNSATKLDYLAEDVKMHVDRLTDLSNALEFPAEDPEENEEEPRTLRVEQRTALDYHTDLILGKFPKAQMELAESLGRISWNRYQRMQQEREINTVSSQEQYDSATKSRFADSVFRDSGLGTSAPATGYAETIISYMTSVAGGKRVQIPQLSAEARAGAQFECNACSRYIYAKTNREWRKHLYLDLQPYTCFYTSCALSSVTFADRQLWSNHLELDHFGPTWESVTCPMCLEATEPGKSHTLIHFARHMEDIALAALPREVESDAESDADTNGGSAQDQNSEDKLSETSLQSKVYSESSRPFNTSEAWAAYHFEMHARKCAYCHNPYEVHRSREQLCEVGHRLAQEVARFIYRKSNGDTYSTLELDGKPIRVQIPAGYVEVASLLRAIERSLRHRSRRSFVPIDETHISAPRIPPLPVKYSTKSRNTPTLAHSDKIEDFDLDENAQRRHAKHYSVEVREPTPREMRDHRSSGYYR